MLPPGKCLQLRTSAWPRVVVYCGGRGLGAGEDVAVCGRKVEAAGVEGKGVGAEEELWACLTGADPRGRERGRCGHEKRGRGRRGWEVVKGRGGVQVRPDPSTS